MKKIFISGSISIKTLPIKVMATLDKLISKQYEILVGDAKWIDLLVQKYLDKKKYKLVKVVSIYNNPRNICDFFNKIKVKYDSNLKLERDRQIVKDVYMTKNSDASFIIWDWKSNGSFYNINRALSNNQEVQVFLDNDFLLKNNITINNILEIFEDRHEYSISEFLRINKNLSIKNGQELKKRFINKGILIKKWENFIPNEKYNMFITKTYIRWKEIFKYRRNIFDKVIDYHQDSLFNV